MRTQNIDTCRSSITLIQKHRFLGRFLLPILAYVGLVLMFFDYGQIVPDSYFPLVADPIGGFLRLFSLWDDITHLGHANTWASTYIFPFGALYGFFGMFLPTFFVQACVFATILFLGITGFVAFTREEYPESALGIRWIGGLFFIFNAYTLFNFSGASCMILPYVVLPWQLLFIRRLLLENRLRIESLLGLVLTTTLMSGMNPPLVAISMVVVGLYLVYCFFTNITAFQRPARVLWRLGIALIAILFINSFWLSGIVSFFVSSANFDTILSEPLSLHTGQTSYYNVFRTLGLWSFGAGWAGKPYQNYAPEYLQSPLWNISMFLLPIFALSGLMLRKRSRIVLFGGMLVIVSIPMIVAIHEGAFVSTYQWLYDHVPLFRMFRAVYKFTTLYVFGLALLLVPSLQAIRNRYARLGASAVVVGLIVLNAFPFFTGRIFEEEKKIPGIPEYFTKVGEFFAKDPSSYRVLLLPEQYFAVYQWGRPMGNPETIWGRPIVARTAGSDETPDNRIILRLYETIADNNIPETLAILRALNVRYIVQRNDYDWQFYHDIAHPPEDIRMMLGSYEKIRSFGALDVYRVPPTMEASVIEGTHTTFVRESPTTFRIRVSHLSKPRAIHLLESFDPNWRLSSVPMRELATWCTPIHYISESDTTECQHGNALFRLSDIAKVFLPTVFDEGHVPIYTYANAWMIDPTYLKEQGMKDSFRTNADGSIDAEFLLEFRPQSIFSLGLVISVTTTAILLLVWLWNIPIAVRIRHRIAR